MFPSGAGIPNYSGSSTYNTSYNPATSNYIPLGFIAPPAAASGVNGFAHITGGTPPTWDGTITQVGALNSGLAISGGSLTTVGQQPYEIALTVNGLFTSSHVLLRKPASLAYTIPANCASSQITLLTNPSGTTFTISLAKNGTQFGTAAIAQTTGAVTWTCSVTSFAAGADILTITAPSTVDTAAAGLGASIYATR